MHQGELRHDVGCHGRRNVDRLMLGRTWQGVLHDMRQVQQQPEVPRGCEVVENSRKGSCSTGVQF